MEESTGRLHNDKSTGVQQMGRGPGVRATSASSIQIDFRYKGERCRERISIPPTPANLKYAKGLKATIDHEIATKTFDYAKHFPESPRVQKYLGASGRSLKTALLAYCDSLCGQLQPETIDEYRLDAEIVAKGLGESTTINSLKRKQIRTWVNSLNLTKKRIDNLLIPLRGALNQAVEDEEIEASPLAGFKIKRAKDPKETIDPFTPAEIEKLSGASDTGPLWKFWAWSGLRTGEIIAIEWSDIGPKCGDINVWRAVRLGREKIPKTASGARRLVPLRPARESLLQLRREDGSVFKNPVTGEAYRTDKQVRVAFQRACAETGVRYRYPYQLRHTFATWGLSSGENPKWIATYMGHKDVMMLFRIYGKWMANLAKDAGSKMLKATKSKAA
jgi:integrase